MAAGMANSHGAIYSTPVPERGKMTYRNGMYEAIGNTAGSRETCSVGRLRGPAEDGCIGFPSFHQKINHEFCRKRLDESGALPSTSLARTHLGNGCPRRSTFCWKRLCAVWMDDRFIMEAEHPMKEKSSTTTLKKENGTAPMIQIIGRIRVHHGCTRSYLDEMAWFLKKSIRIMRVYRGMWVGST